MHLRRRGTQRLASRASQSAVKQRCVQAGAWLRIIRVDLVRLLNPDSITTADYASLCYGSIHTDVDLVMSGRSAQDSRILREIPLRESGHHATTARCGDVQAHRRPDGKRATDPGILRKALLIGGKLQHDVRTKPPGFKAALRVQLTQAIECGRR